MLLDSSARNISDPSAPAVVGGQMENAERFPPRQDLARTAPSQDREKRRVGRCQRSPSTSPACALTAGTKARITLQHRTKTFHEREQRPGWRGRQLYINRLPSTAKTSRAKGICDTPIPAFGRRNAKRPAFGGGKVRFRTKRQAEQAQARWPTRS